MNIATKLLKPSELPSSNILTIYGRGGTGKTTFSSSAPKPMFYMDIKDRGTDSIRDVDGIDVLPIDDFDEIELSYWYLKKKHRKYRTIVWDTISQAQDLAAYKLYEKRGIKFDSGSIGKWGTLRRQDFGDIAGQMKKWIIAYKDLAIEHNMVLIFIAHDRIFNFDEENDVDEEITPEVGPRVMPSVAATLNGNSSVVVNTFIRRHTERRRVKNKIKANTELQYCMRVGPHEYYLTKMRKPKRVILPQVIIDPTYDTLMGVTTSWQGGQPPRRRSRSSKSTSPASRAARRSGDGSAPTSRTR